MKFLLGYLIGMGIAFILLLPKLMMNVHYETWVFYTILTLSGGSGPVILGEYLRRQYKQHEQEG